MYDKINLRNMKCTLNFAWEDVIYFLQTSYVGSSGGLF